MPRYHFHLTDGKSVLKDRGGLDLPGEASAREEAVVLAHELKHGKVLPGRNWNDWFVEVVDERGRKIDAVPIHAVPEVLPLPL
jgi:hypothetical protein